MLGFISYQLSAAVSEKWPMALMAPMGDLDPESEPNANTIDPLAEAVPVEEEEVPLPHPVAKSSSLSLDKAVAGPGPQCHQTISEPIRSSLKWWPPTWSWRLWSLQTICLIFWLPQHRLA